MRETAPLSESHTVMSEILMPNDANNLGRALGGSVLHWMDICAAISSRRFSQRQVVTASMDHVDFLGPIDLGDIVTIEGYVFETGRTSMEVVVNVGAERPCENENRTLQPRFSRWSRWTKTRNRRRCRTFAVRMANRKRSATTPSGVVANAGKRWVRRKTRRSVSILAYDQSSDPPLWYSVTCVSKKFFSLLRSVCSDIHGNGFSVPYCSGRSNCPNLRSAMCST